MSTDHNHTKPTLADKEAEAYQIVSTMPTTPEKFDPSVVPVSITDGLGGLKGSTNSWQLSRSVPVLRSALHFSLHDCDETTACSFDSIAHIGTRLSSSGKPKHSSYLHCWCT